MQYKNEKEQSNVVSAKMLSTYSDAEFWNFYWNFAKSDHPELTYQEISEQEHALLDEKHRRLAARKKKRLPWYISAILAAVFSAFFIGKSDLACEIFFFAAVGLAIYAFTIKGGAAEKDEEE